MKNLAFILTLTLAAQATAHTPQSSDTNRKIQFPDVPGYKTLKCDFHQHTVFSDGKVWPSIRVEEALKDGLDAISLTEHLEYQPHQDDIPHPDRNRAFQVAQAAAKGKPLVVANGSEITRDMPPGHANAIFLQDATKLLVDDPIAVFKEAKAQGAFTFWNHPNWLSQAKDGIAELTDMHRQLIRDGLLQGIEVVNDLTYSDEAIQIALDHNLTMMGTSDIHGLIDWQYGVPLGGHRPITLVFAKENTELALKEALNARRTAVWFNNTLIGKPDNLVPLIQASISVKSANYAKDTSVANVTLNNSSDAEFLLENLSEYALHANADLISVPPQTTTKIQVKTLKLLDAFSLKFKVWNAITAPKTHPDVTIDVKIK